MFTRLKNPVLRYFFYLVYFVIILFCAIELNFLWLFGHSPNTEDIKNPTLSIASDVYTADGKLIGRYYKENRQPVEFEKISLNLIHALVSTEDTRFYQHHGVD
ncbi:MAG: penicillin-binding protein, partial [Sphingobacteriaceae bacterium]